MIFNNTINKKQIRREIDRLIGKPFSFIERWKHGGNSSRRLEVIGISQGLSDFFAEDLDDTQVSIQLRNKGILVYIKNRFSEFVWPIPYYRLSLYQSDFFSIHAEGNYIRIDKASMVKDNRLFLKKLVELRATFLEAPHRS